MSAGSAWDPWSSTPYGTGAYSGGGFANASPAWDPWGSAPYGTGAYSGGAWDPWAGTPYSNATNYNTFQQQSFLPPWQASIPAGRNSPDVVDAINQAANSTGLSPAALTAVFGVETGNWDPRTVTNSNYGLPQMSQNMWGDYGGNFGGLNWNDYVNASAPRQIDAYADWLNRSNNLNKGYGGVTDQDPVMQAALLQAIQFGGNSMGWRNALAEGNMSVPVAPNPNRQAKALRPTSLDAMYGAYSNMMSPWYY